MSKYFTVLLASVALLFSSMSFAGVSYNYIEGGVDLTGSGVLPTETGRQMIGGSVGLHKNVSVSVKAVSEALVLRDVVRTGELNLHMPIMTKNTMVELGIGAMDNGAFLGDMVGTVSFGVRHAYHMGVEIGAKIIRVGMNDFRDTVGEIHLLRQIGNSAAHIKLDYSKVVDRSDTSKIGLGIRLAF